MYVGAVNSSTKGWPDSTIGGRLLGVSMIEEYLDEDFSTYCSTDNVTLPLQATHCMEFLNEGELKCKYLSHLK